MKLHKIRTTSTQRRTNSTLMSNSMKSWHAMTRSTTCLLRSTMPGIRKKTYKSANNWSKDRSHAKSGQQITTTVWSKNSRFLNGSSSPSTQSRWTNWKITVLENESAPKWLTKNNSASNSGSSVSRQDVTPNKNLPNANNQASRRQIWRVHRTKTVTGSYQAATAKALTTMTRCQVKTSYWTRRTQGSGKTDRNFS